MTTYLGVLVVEVVLLSGVVLEVVELVAEGVSVGVKLTQVQAVLTLAGASAGDLRIEEFIALRNKNNPNKNQPKQHGVSDQQGGGE